MRLLFMTTVFSIRESYIPCVAQILHLIFETATDLKRGTVVASFQKTAKLVNHIVCCLVKFHGILLGVKW